MTITLNDRNPPRPALHARLAGWVRGPTFGRDIVIVLAIKFSLLMVLKYTFFNHPLAENMSMPPALVAQALLSVPASHPSQGEQHAR
jgi:hypothetical protein